MNNNIFSTPLPTKEDHIRQAAEAIRYQGVNGIGSLKATIQTIFDIVYNSPEYTCQDIFDYFGTDAAQLFIMAGAATMLIKKIDPSYTPPPPPVEITINDDGTVTSHEQAE